MPKENKRKRCHNCAFAGEAFKVVGMTHVHCHNEALYPPEKMNNGEISTWDTLKEFYTVCSSHMFKQLARNHNFIASQIG